MIRTMNTHPVSLRGAGISRVGLCRRQSGPIKSIVYPPPSSRPQSGLERRLARWFLLVLVWGTAATALGGPTLMGRPLAALVWIAQAVLAALALVFSTRGKIVFPILVWLPWLIWILLRCDFAEFYCVQRTAMLWVGPLVGISASAVIRDQNELSWLLRSLRVIVVLSLAIYVLSVLHVLPTGMVFSGCSLMTLCLAASLLAPYVLAGNRRDTFLWLSCLAMCTREAWRITIGTCIMTLALTPTRQPLQKRLLAVIVTGMLGIAVLSVPQVKDKMLDYSGHDSLRELARNPGDTYSSGRFFMWELYLREAWKQPLLGHGGNASQQFGVNLAGWAHPHCDYIRVFFEYGAIGIVLLGIPSFYTLVFTYRRTRAASSAVLRDAWAVSCGGFISMGLLAITDNVMLYIAYFGCLLFGLVGAACGASAIEPALRRPGVRLYGH
jgi:hypothetical protein